MTSTPSATARSKQRGAGCLPCAPAWRSWPEWGEAELHGGARGELQHEPVPSSSPRRSVPAWRRRAVEEVRSDEHEDEGPAPASRVLKAHRREAPLRPASTALLRLHRRACSGLAGERAGLGKERSSLDPEPATLTGTTDEIGRRRSSRGRRRWARGRSESELQRCWHAARHTPTRPHHTLRGASVVSMHAQIENERPRMQ
jgi:hypothetical protein